MYLHLPTPSAVTVATSILHVGMAWAEARQTQRNRLARQPFDVIWVRNEKVVAV
jgi:hypothetical protein